MTMTKTFLYSFGDNALIFSQKEATQLYYQGSDFILGNCVEGREKKKGK